MLIILTCLPLSCSPDPVFLFTWRYRTLGLFLSLIGSGSFWPVCPVLTWCFWTGSPLDRTWIWCRLLPELVWTPAFPTRLSESSVRSPWIPSRVLPRASINPLKPNQTWDHHPERTWIRTTAFQEAQMFVLVNEMRVKRWTDSHQQTV